MKRFILHLLILSTLICCNNNQKIPENVLPPNKMQSVLWDMLQADEMAGYQLPKDTTITRLERYTTYYQDIFQLHKISKETFKTSLKYYESRPDLLKNIFDSLQYKADSTGINKPAAPKKVS